MTTKTILLLVGALLAYWAGKKTIARVVNNAGKEREIAESRISYVSAFLSMMWGVLITLVLVVVAGIQFDDFGLFVGSVFAVLGVALFAQWSILSNITASIIVFFFFPYRVGDQVRIVDGENSVEGVIKEISLFHVILSDKDKSIVTYPNSMVFQKAVRITPPQADCKASSKQSDVNDG